MQKQESHPVQFNVNPTEVNEHSTNDFETLLHQDNHLESNNVLVESSTPKNIVADSIKSNIAKAFDTSRLVDAFTSILSLVEKQNNQINEQQREMLSMKGYIEKMDEKLTSRIDHVETFAKDLAQITVGDALVKKDPELFEAHPILAAAGIDLHLDASELFQKSAIAMTSRGEQIMKTGRDKSTFNTARSAISFIPPQEELHLQQVQQKEIPPEVKNQRQGNDEYNDSTSEQYSLNELTGLMSIHNEIEQNSQPLLTKEALNLIDSKTNVDINIDNDDEEDALSELYDDLPKDLVISRANSAKSRRLPSPQHTSNPGLPPMNNKKPTYLELQTNNPPLRTPTNAYQNLFQNSTKASIQPSPVYHLIPDDESRRRQSTVSIPRRLNKRPMTASNLKLLSYDRRQIIIHELKIRGHFISAVKGFVHDKVKRERDGQFALKRRIQDLENGIEILFDSIQSQKRAMRTILPTDFEKVYNNVVNLYEANDAQTHHSIINEPVPPHDTPKMLSPRMNIPQPKLITLNENGNIPDNIIDLIRKQLGISKNLESLSANSISQIYTDLTDIRNEYILKQDFEDILNNKPGHILSNKLRNTIYNIIQSEQTALINEMIEKIENVKKSVDNYTDERIKLLQQEIYEIKLNASGKSAEINNLYMKLKIQVDRLQEDVEKLKLRFPDNNEDENDFGLMNGLTVKQQLKVIYGNLQQQTEKEMKDYRDVSN